MGDNTPLGEPPDRGRNINNSGNVDTVMESDCEIEYLGSTSSGSNIRDRSSEYQVSAVNNNLCQEKFQDLIRMRKLHQEQRKNTKETIYNSNNTAHKEISINQQKERPIIFYEPNDTGPLIVYVENKKGNIGRAHLITVGKIINQCLPNMERDIKQITSIGVNRVKVELATIISANKLINSEYLKKNNYEAYIPLFLKRRQGVIKFVDYNISEDELKQVIKPLLGENFKVLNVRRINRKIVDPEGQVKYAPTSTIIVTFNGQMLPKKVVIHSILMEVVPYIQKVVQCMKCLRYGHLHHQCKGNERCAKCGEPHKLEDCKSVSEFCVLCKTEGHKANNYTKCPEYKLQKSIKETMGIENMTYREAKKKHETSYATATQNRETNHVSNVLTQETSSVSKKRKTIEGGNPLLQQHLAILKKPSVEQTNMENLRNIPQYHRQDNNGNDTVIKITNLIIDLVKDILEKKEMYSLNDNLAGNIKYQISQILTNNE